MNKLTSSPRTSSPAFRWPLLASAILGAALCPSAEALTIVPTFDTSITLDPNGAAMMAAINLAIAQEQSFILNPVTVGIVFKNVNTGLGSSTTFFTNLSYSQYRTDLLTNQILSANDNTALATLPATATNPVNGSANVHLTLPLLRAIGETALGDNSFNSGVDSTIDLNMSLMNFLRTGAQDPAKYDLEQVTLHEIEEVLGSGGGGSRLGDAGTAVGSLDLYRYSAAGVRSYSTAATSAYFSINGGTTNLSFFNQTAGADYSDWDGTPANAFAQVQDAFSDPGLQLNLDTTEKTTIDVVGWNIVPEPGSAALLLAASPLLGFRRRRALAAA